MPGCVLGENKVRQRSLTCRKSNEDNLSDNIGLFFFFFIVFSVLCGFIPFDTLQLNLSFAVIFSLHFSSFSFCVPDDGFSLPWPHTVSASSFFPSPASVSSLLLFLTEGFCSSHP